MSIYMWRDVTSAWIYHNSTLWLITIADGSWNDITIADKNLWATTVYNVWDALSQNNCWNYYQRWNNYWFPFTWAVTTSSSQVDASNYWPWNYYSSSTFITGSQNWSSNNNKNLWWWETNTNEAMRWPCLEWFHIPTSSEWWNLLWSWRILNTLWLNINKWTDTKIYLKMPFAWYMSESSWSQWWQWSIWYYWGSNCGNIAYYAYNINFNSSSMNASTQYYKTLWQSIRPFKNTPIQPDESWTVLYQPS